MCEAAQLSRPRRPRRRARALWGGIILFGLLAGLAAPAPADPASADSTAALGGPTSEESDASPAAGAPPATKAAAAPPATKAAAASVRGTERPLPRGASALQKTGRAVLFVPYVAAGVVAWPVTKLAYVEERYHPLQTMADLLSFQRRRQGVILRGSFGYESSTGIAVVGGSVIAGDWLGTGARFKLNGGYLDRDRNQAVVTLSTPPARFEGELSARYDNRKDRPYFGLGPDSPDRVAGYNRERRLVEGTLRAHPTSWLTASVAGYLRGVDLAPPATGTSVAALFPADYDLARDTRYRGTEAMLTLDRRDRGEFSTRGGLLRLVGGINEARSGEDADYRHYAAEAQAFINLYHRDRILALRALARGIDADDPGRVPFTELPALGGKHGLRGYSRYRFIDEKALLLTAEYRYPVTAMFGARLVGEWGSVASTWEKLRLADVDPVIGIALVADLPDWPLTVQLSRSPEGLELYVGTESLFTYESRRTQ